MTLATLAPGFADPVESSQRCFRAVMRAMAEPGTFHPLEILPEPPQPMISGLATVLLALCDNDTPVWLSPSLASSQVVQRFIAFHCGAPVVTAPDDAMFAFAASWQDLPDFADFAQGTPEYPDRSTTLVVACDGTGMAATLAGPGIKGTIDLRAGLLPSERIMQHRLNHSRFPMGVDLVMTLAHQVFALPRSTAIKEQN